MWLRESGTVDAAGVVTVSLGAPGTNHPWVILRLIVRCLSTTPTRFGLYEGYVDPLTMIDGTYDGNDDVGLENPVLPVEGSRELIAQWTGVSALDDAGLPTRAYVAVQLVTGRQP